MEPILYYIIPFCKNLGVLYLTIFTVFLVSSIVKNKGLAGFSFSFWFHDNRDRFTAGGIVVFCLSLLMAVTDAAPLFSWVGLDINSSPVALGVGLSVLLGLAPTKQRRIKKVEAVREIQTKAGELLDKSAELVKAEEKTAKPKPKRVRKPKIGDK